MTNDQRISVKEKIKQLTSVVFDPNRSAKIMLLLPGLEPAKLSELLLDTREGKQLTEWKRLLEANK